MELACSHAPSLLRRRALLAGVSVVLGAAMLLGTAIALASVGHRSSITSGGAAVPGPQLPAAGPSPSPSVAAESAPSAVPAGSVRLPLFGGAEPSGPPPAPRPGSWISVPSVGLQVAVVDYTDCTGNTSMTRVSAVHFTCTPAAVTQFVGHNPGVFTPLLGTHAGDRVVYQHDGVQEVYTLQAPRRVSPQEAAAYSQDGSFVHAVFATCAEPDSSAYWVFIANPPGSTGAPPSSQPRVPAPGNTPRPSPSPSGTGGSPVGGGNGGGGGVPGGLVIPSPPPPPI
ncbi:MAG: sortase domain-bontaining protein [Candidatus Dormibacteria bacterium]